MKLAIFCSCVLYLCLVACSPRINDLQGQVFKSNRTHLTHGNILLVNQDTTYVFIKHGPATYYSEGKWRFDQTTKKIILMANTPVARFVKPAKIDTLWIDVNNQEIKVSSRKVIIFQEVKYYLQRIN